MREKTLWTAMAFVLALLAATVLCADDKKVPNTGGHSAPAPQRSAPAPQRSAPTPHTSSAPSYHPQTNTSRPPTNTAPTNQGGGNNRTGYNPGGYRPNTPTNTNPTPAGTNRTPGYNQGNRTPNTTTPNNGNRTPGYNPAGGNTGGNTNTRPGYNQGGNNTNTRPGYNQGGNNTNTRPGYNQGGNNTNTRPGYNQGGNTNTRPGYNQGGNTGGYNSGGRTGGYNQSTFRPPAGAQASSRPGGGMTYAHNGANYHTDHSGRLTGYSRPGTEARFGSNGRVSSAHFTRSDRSQVYVNRGPRGERTIVTVRTDRTRIVSYGPRYGYYERPYRAGFVSRTYIYGGRPFVRVYHTWGWRGMMFYGYVPPVYYAPAFYGWAWAPWRAPIVFSWGWRSDPWFGFYGGYFTPAPVYPTASLWLTDYLLAENLRLAYESRQAAIQAGQQAPPPQEYQPQPGQSGPVTLTPEVRAAIAEEVRQQLEAERAAANAPQGGGYNQPTGGYPPPQGQPGGYTPTGGEAPPPALDPKQRIFVVSSNLDVTVVGGQGCALTPGDIILRTGDTVVNGNRVGVSVLSSKPGDCPCNAATEIELVALQEMHNQFREQIDNGMRQLADNQGRNGLPPAPAANPRNAPDGQAPADSAATVEQALAQQQADAGRAEQEVYQAAGGGQ
jgi:hypothetical protein